MSINLAWLLGGMLLLAQGAWAGGADDGATPSSTSAPTTAPAMDAWSANVQALSAGLTTGDLAAVRGSLREDVTIRSFASEQSLPILKIFDRTMGALTVSVRSYRGVPRTLASDVASDIRARADLPEAVSSHLLPADENLPQANATAAQWITDTLAPQADQPIAVILLCYVHEGNADQRVQTIAVLARSVDGQKAEVVIFGEPSKNAR